MTVFALVVAVVVVVVLLAGIVSYNRFVSQRNLVRSSWANIDTELKRRYDLIPNLVETVKGYAGHERQTLEAVTAARAGAAAATGSPAAQATAEGPLVSALRQLLAVSERYPDLKANQGFLQLQGELENTEDRLQAARRFYNANVQDYNRRVQAFPSSLVASRFGFREEELFEIEPAMRAQVSEAPRVDFGTPGPSLPPAGSGPPLPPGGTDPPPT